MIYIKTILINSLFFLLSCGSTEEGAPQIIPGNTNAAIINDSNVAAILDNLVDSVGMTFGAVIGRTIIIDNSTGMSYTGHDNACFNGVANLNYDINNDVNNVNLLNGQIAYIDYDNCFAVRINGGAKIQGALALSTNNIEHLTMQLNNIQAARLTDGKIFSINGPMKFTWNPSVNTSTGYTLLLDVTVTDLNTGDTYRFDGFKIDVMLAAGVNYAMLNGRFYHSQHGYVDVSTTSVLRYDHFNTTPNNGSLYLIGDAQKAEVFYSGFIPAITISDNP